MKFSPCRLEIEGLSLERGGRRLFGELSLIIESGESLLVTGPNGAGKTSLLRALAGLLTPAEGRIAFRREGLEPRPLPLCAHYLGHLDGLKPSMSALENLSFWASMLALGEESVASPVEALAALGLSHVSDLPVAYLSAGQRRRAALARLLAARRPVWLLDEPATALDIAAQERLEELMNRHLAEGGILVAAIHAPLRRIHGRGLRLGAGPS